ncbi:MAG: STAS domain-containing protein [Planctomycetaceae bacterium]|nr:STAS domain-containing protein [Planctomycetaceae bacterium]
MSDTTTFQLEVDQGLMTVTFLPRLNQIPWADIEQVGSQVVQRIHSLSSPRVLVDLTPLDYMGSAQVALIVRLFKGVKEKSGSMVVATNHPVVQEVLSLAGLNKIWTIVGTRDEGRRMLGASSVGQTSEVGGGVGLAVGGMIGALVGGIALVLAFSGSAAVPATAAAWVALLAAAAAFGMGLGATLNGHGPSRNMGVGALVLGMVMLLGSVFAIASPKAEAQPKPSNSARDGGDKVEENTEEEEAPEPPKKSKTKSKPAKKAEPAAEEEEPAPEDAAPKNSKTKETTSTDAAPPATTEPQQGS